MSIEEMLAAADITDHQAREAVRVLSRLAQAYLPLGYMIELRASRDGTTISLSRIDGDALKVADITWRRGWLGAIDTANRDWAARQQESR